MILTVRSGIYEVQDEISNTFVECVNRLEAKETLLVGGVREEAIEEAFDNILERGHRRAVFGIRGTFIFSEK